MNKQDLSVQVIEMSKYTVPEIKENRQNDVVEYGADNNYFQFLIDRATNSTTNRSIITGICNMVYGRGLSATDSNVKPEQYAKMMALIKPKDLKRIIQDRKKLGMGAIQVTYNKGQVSAITHFPMETLRAKKIDPKGSGEIEAWYYHPNWAEKRPSDVLKEFPAFGKGNQKGNEIYILQDYNSGYKYYAPCDYSGALAYAILEEEISDYLINDTINGFSGTKVINFNNGIPSDEKQKQIAKDVTGKVTGARGQKVIVAFNNNSESATTVEDFALNDAPAHYQYLADECRNKLIVGHRVTSPLLIGVRETGGGLGNNSDEIINASLLFDNYVIKPYQNEIIEALDEILSINNISLNIYFKTIQPLEFMEVDGLDKETKEEETGIKMNKDIGDFNDSEMLDKLKGDTIDEDEWELVDEREVSDENESIEDWAKKNIKERPDFFTKLANYITSKPDGFSYLDRTLYKVRYSYEEKYSSNKSRDFCTVMMQRTSQGIVYRLEDIDQASREGINKELGHKRQPYDLYRFKGGVNCGHVWNEKLYRLKDKTLKRDKLDNFEPTESIPKSVKKSPVGTTESTIAPIDMPNNGHHPNYKG